MSNKIITRNPFSGEVLKEYALFNDEEIKSILHTSDNVFNEWKKKPLKNRVKLLNKLADILHDQKVKYANLISQEMGKPYKESISEIEKCISLIEFYEKNAEMFLADELIKTDARESFISYDPLGCILAIMPWNYPFWQVMRFAVPTITAGNTVLLKHANNVTGCALVIQDLFKEAGYPKGCFQNVLATHEQVEEIITNDLVKAVSLTGSEKAGRAIAKVAGNSLKKTVLELGGNNACIIWNDADLDKYLQVIVKARFQNAGQSCIAAKRFIVEDEIYDLFLEKFKKALKNIKIGDPLHSETELATLARIDLAEGVEHQVTESIKKGARVVVGNKRDKAFFEPTILTDVTPGMPVFDEEVFGPVAAIIRAKDKEHSIQLASESNYGLGTMLFTENIDKAKKEITKIEDGAFFINEMVKSDPRLPFGGTKASGYGRELSKEGILEFVNKKTVYIK
ncbi:succinate-semialdehyde dehydrogenase / glutarate-semialdehyde dehydrogenase [Aquimarina amphilecti]|uniref:Succinate-semialdehyde dehydrogenase / glutarate-semialdehyde dehydrogenase n=1 Tax=Aquimarina amphilecti TaxID=1038014 RepID=A0A1H7UDL3_AQUAM|nr:NAD-dependent succinate-semialdehyde dehydrogenase [Aquimarina amphilecti]SEL94909.1 succinate-semialdehyde dehydrogenase / glutarate-semialdehyde dehydrogenase [Aquimarina amphilecti]